MCLDSKVLHLQAVFVTVRFQRGLPGTQYQVGCRWSLVAHGKVADSMPRVHTLLHFDCLMKALRCMVPERVEPSHGYNCCPTIPSLCQPEFLVSYVVCFSG